GSRRLRSTRRPVLHPLADQRTEFWGRCTFNRSDKAISLAANCLYIFWRVRRVSYYLSQPGDCGIQAALVINENAVRPDPLDQHFSRTDFARSFKEAHQKLQGLILQPHADTVLAQFSGTGVELEHTETKATALQFRLGAHGFPV